MPAAHYLTRRTVLCAGGAGAAGLCAFVLTGCSSGSSSSATTSAATDRPPAPRPMSNLGDAASARRRGIGRRRNIGFLGRRWQAGSQAQRYSGRRFDLGDARRQADHLGSAEHRQGRRVHRDLHAPGLHGQPRWRGPQVPMSCIDVRRVHRQEHRWTRSGPVGRHPGDRVRRSGPRRRMSRRPSKDHRDRRPRVSRERSR